MKKCTKCQQNKSILEFNKDKSKSDGYTSNCKFCRSLASSLYYRDNSRTIQGKRAVYNSNYRKKNKEKISNYQKKRYSENKQTYKELAHDRYLKNKEHIKLQTKAWKERNPERAKEIVENWRIKNLHLKRFYCATRRAKKLQATPKWADLERIKEFYKSCPKGYEVDHIVPLNNELVCGLHTMENLQYLTIKANREKGNKYEL